MPSRDVHYSRLLAKDATITRPTSCFDPAGYRKTVFDNRQSDVRRWRHPDFPRTRQSTQPHPFSSRSRVYRMLRVTIRHPSLFSLIFSLNRHTYCVWKPITPPPGGRGLHVRPAAFAKSRCYVVRPFLTFLSVCGNGHTIVSPCIQSAEQTLAEPLRTRGGENRHDVYAVHWGRRRRRRTH